MGGIIMLESEVLVEGHFVSWSPQSSLSVPAVQFLWTHPTLDDGLSSSCICLNQDSEFSEGKTCILSVLFL